MVCVLNARDVSKHSKMTIMNMKNMKNVVAQCKRD